MEGKGTGDDRRRRTVPLRAAILATAATILLAAACSGPRDAAPQRAPSSSGDDTMMFIEIEGTRDEIRGLNDIDGLELSRGGEDLGGGRIKTRAFVRRNAAIDEIRARGLTVRVTKDEAEIKRRIQKDQDAIDRAKRAK